MADHADELFRKYAGRVVAIYQGRVVAVGDRAQEVAAQVKHLPTDAHPLIYEVPTEKDLVAILPLVGACHQSQ